MASISYTSFPPVVDESPSPVLIPLDHFSGRDTPTLPVDLNCLEISDTAAEDEDFATSLTPLDCAGYHLAPTTPTKERNRRATMPEPSKHRPQDFIGLISPPQTPDYNLRIQQSTTRQITRPETPPPSTHRPEIPVSPETPTHPPLHIDITNDATLFDDKNFTQGPSTPVLYNLIRNEGPPKFVVPPGSLGGKESIGLDNDDGLGGFEGDTSLRGHPSACLFVASLNSTKSEDHLRKSVTDLFSKWGSLLNVKVLKDWANRPFSFVQYTTAQEAAYALHKCQKATLDGRMIRVERARVNRTLYVSKDKGKIDEAAIKALLEPFGQIEELVIPGSWKRNSKEVRKGCFARFVFRDDAINAYQTLRSSDTYSIEWAQNLDRSNSPMPSGTMPKVPIDYTSIFIGQLDRSTDERAVRERFGRYGTIVGVQVLAKQNIIGRRPGDNGVSGFAFVKYDGRDAATKAVKAENGAVFHGRTIRVQYRELHQKLFQTGTIRNPISMTPKLAPPPPRHPHPQPQVQLQGHPLNKMPATLGQLSGTGGLASDAFSGFGGFDPVTGIANGVYGNINPQFFAAYNAAVAAATSSGSTPSNSPNNQNDCTSQDRRVLNPLAPPFMLLHPFPLAYTPNLHHPITRQQPQDSASPHPVLQHWYPHPPSTASTEHAPFPTMPTAPADFASPLPLGPMVAVQCLSGFNPASENVTSQGIMWDPSLGMYRTTNGVGVFEQVSNEGAANAA